MSSQRRSCDRAEHMAELQGALEEWTEQFKKYGLKMNLEKTEEVASVNIVERRVMKNLAKRRSCN